MSELPEGWKSCKLGEFMDFKNGINTDKSQYGKGYKFVNVMDIFNNDFLTEDVIIGRVDIDEKKLKDNGLSYGDILFNRTSETFDEIAISAVFLDNKPVTFGGFVIRGRPNLEYLSPSYSIYAFQSSGFRSQVIRLGQGAIRSNIGQKDLSKVIIYLPPLPEQRKIAEILSTWDKAIATTEKRIANSKQQKKALMQQLLTGKRRLAGFSGDWEVVKLGDVCKINPPKPPQPLDELVSFIPMDAVSENAQIVRQEVRMYSTVSKGFSSFINSDTLVAKITPCFENGKGAFLTNLKNGVGFGSTEFHVLRSNENTCPNYIYFLTNTKEFRVKGEQNMQGSAGQKRLTTDYLKLLKISLPPLPEQRKIAQVLTTADKEISALETQLSHLQQEKKALMQQLLTGKRRVVVAES